MLSELSALKCFRIVYGSTPQFGTSSRSHFSPQVGSYRLELGSQLWFPSQIDVVCVLGNDCSETWKMKLVRSQIDHRSLFLLKTQW